ncbi:hypothetical protein VMCG_07904 [Cytospora schulzeri]|uniref:Uncharacterized protein n=1 Tax=Cytospora schulzeri TaxID=448051 RepID=A0A423W0D3_9PEZI|nr:hypothetical protein VMCG_07904 [Valsa malicola]
MERNQASWKEALGNNAPTAGVALERVHDKSRCGQFAIPMIDVFSTNAVMGMKTFVSSKEAVMQPDQSELGFLQQMKDAFQKGRPLPFFDSIKTHQAPNEIINVDYKTPEMSPPFFRLPGIWLHCRFDAPPSEDRKNEIDQDQKLAAKGPQAKRRPETGPAEAPPLPPMFPGMSSKEPHEMLAGFQMSYLHDCLGKTFKCAKKMGIPLEDLVPDKKLFLTHPSLPPLEDMDEFRAETEVEEEVDDRPPTDEEVQKWVEELRKLRTKGKGSVHPRFSSFEAWINKLGDVNIRASWNEGTRILLNCLEHFVEAEYYKTVPLDWAHFQGSKEEMSSLDPDSL